jgi:RHS repeat-associated protein
VTAVNAPGRQEGYRYDLAGNQTEAEWQAPEDTPQWAAAGARRYDGTPLTRAGRMRNEYDAAGRVILRQQIRLSRKPDTCHYTWNAEDQLTRVVTPDGTVWQYAYDPMGRRIAKLRQTAEGEVAERTDFTWRDTKLVEQTTRDGADGAEVSVSWEHYGPHSVAQVDHRPADPDTADRDIDRRFHLIVTDLVGTPTEVVDDQGATVWSRRTALWGLEVESDGQAEQPLRFPGQYADEETGWYYNYQRHYDPAVARYSTPDPLGLAPAANPYTYPHNPFTWADPLGLAAHIWSATKKKSPVQNAYGHYKKHGNEFPDVKNANDYVKKATDFVQNPARRRPDQDARQRR